MKKIIFALVAFFTLTLVSCTNKTEKLIVKQLTTDDVEVAEIMVKTIVSNFNTTLYVARAITVDKHGCNKEVIYKVYYYDTDGELKEYNEKGCLILQGFCFGDMIYEDLYHKTFNGRTSYYKLEVRHDF